MTRRRPFQCVNDFLSGSRKNILQKFIVFHFISLLPSKYQTCGFKYLVFCTIRLTKAFGTLAKKVAFTLLFQLAHLIVVIGRKCAPLRKAIWVTSFADVLFVDDR